MRFILHRSNHFFSNLFSCQLVLKEGGDYSVYSADPDAVIVWENIEKVVSLH